MNKKKLVLALVASPLALLADNTVDPAFAPAQTLLTELSTKLGNWVTAVAPTIIP